MTAMEALENYIQSMKDEIASLKAELKAINATLDDPRTDLTLTACEVIKSLKAQVSEIQAARHVMQQYNRLLKQLADCQKDAERYRWMRVTFISDDDTWPDDVADAKTGLDLDTSIDAAIAAQKEEAK